MSQGPLKEVGPGLPRLCWLGGWQGSASGRIVYVLVLVGIINVWMGESIVRQEGKSASSVGKASGQQMANGMGEGARWKWRMRMELMTRKLKE